MLEKTIKTQNVTIIFSMICLMLLNSCALFKPAKNEGEPQFKEYYFTNKDGDKIEGSVSPSLGYIYLNIVTENAIGEKVNLNLDDEETEIDYIYKGKYISKGLSFKVRKNIEKIKLYIYDDSNRRHRRKKEKAMNTIQRTDN